MRQERNEESNSNGEKGTVERDVNEQEQEQEQEEHEDTTEAEMSNY